MKNDLTGQRFGRWVALSCSGGEYPSTYKWLCRCDCGTTREVGADRLKSGNSKSCGCLTRESSSRRLAGTIARNLIDLTGRAFGRLTVVSQGETRKGIARWNCQCKCGKTSVVTAGHLRSGHTKSCGCAMHTGAGSRTHGRCRTPMYFIWTNIIQRCYNPECTHYQNYGGRGVGMCERWRNSFEDFLADMGERPSKNHSVDRYPDQNGNYEPSNCRWATMKQQNRNRRNNTLLTHDGETLTLAEWSERFGVKQATVCYRLKHGWSVADAITTPPLGKSG